MSLLEGRYYYKANDDGQYSNKEQRQSFDNHFCGISSLESADFFAS